jgi:hypothetical protein
MWHKVKDLSPDQRLAIESLLGRRLADDEGLNIQPSRILKEAPEGEERKRAYQRYLSHSDALADRAAQVSDDELDGAIDEACDHVRHRSPS